MLNIIYIYSWLGSRIELNLCCYPYFKAKYHGRNRGSK